MKSNFEFLFNMAMNIFPLVALFLGVYYELNWLENTALIVFIVGCVVNALCIFLASYVIDAIQRNRFTPTIPPSLYFVFDGAALLLLIWAGYVPLAIIFVTLSIGAFIVYRIGMRKRFRKTHMSL